jgi:hypothetical protein
LRVCWVIPSITIIEQICSKPRKWMYKLSSFVPANEFSQTKAIRAGRSS